MQTHSSPKPVAEMSQEEIIGCRRWPAHLIVDQMRAQLEWEEAQDIGRYGCLRERA